jgi:hypothetical protein
MTRSTPKVTTLLDGQSHRCDRISILKKTTEDYRTNLGQCPWMAISPLFLFFFVFFSMWSVVHGTNLKRGMRSMIQHTVAFFREECVIRLVPLDTTQAHRSHLNYRWCSIYHLSRSPRLICREALFGS